MTKETWRGILYIVYSHFHMRFLSEILEELNRTEQRKGTNDKRDVERHPPSCLLPSRLRLTPNTDISSDLAPHWGKSSLRISTN